ncbi:MAG: hypothetical protein QOI11_1353 [Candidatus Eremiobacteraeota bacterium]|jgi:hypothetical protein|nr:hypothetical protein [Candidatus Eremiobacteraeota bacterium]
MPSITVSIIALLIALASLVGSVNAGTTSRPVVGPPVVHTSDVGGGSPTH